ncbi:hypothetical protein WS71_22350 [Burkholderia mayonis]|uniref:Autotransporter domain-containing protein n=1 Tax=Burkholderia mayonis TaxID=1385591 RepID=A0A1B4G243_9BURK|nr:hypothetical protein WS71_22350 [Burkholderia mayonis]
MQKGWSIIGNVVGSVDSTNKLILGGSATDLSSNPSGSSQSTVFDVSQIGDKYQGFSAQEKVGTSTWQLIGTTSALTPWTISGGTLQINGDGNLGDTASVLTFDGGTLQFGSGAELSANRAIALKAAGGTIDTRALNNTLAQNITGLGKLTKNGIGTLTLTGTNAYTGDTKIAAGTLQLGNGGSSGSIVGNVTDNGMLSFNRRDTKTYGGAISGPGAVTQSGSGTTVLTGSNTYTGGTKIAVGTLQLGNGGSSGSIVGNVTDNGMLSFNRRDTKTYGGAISGPGAVTQSGSGTTVLTGSNTYTGGTKIAAGTLQLGNGGSSGSIVGNVTDNGMLSFNRRDTKTYGGAISGPGAVTQSGSGTTVLTGSNTYTGGTKIAVGTLQLGNGGSSGSIVGNVTDNGMLSFNRRDTKTYGGAISGPGAVTQSGSGTTVLTGSNTYTGGTKIAVGTLQLGNGGSSGSIVGNVTDNGMLSFNRRDTKTYGGAISGPGAVTQSGSGTTVLTGSNTYTGGTKIAVGTLQLGNGGSSGSIVGNVTDNGMLSFNRRDTKTYGGAISGPGAVTQSGSGTTVLTGSNTYTGGTKIAVGTLQLGNGGSSGSIVGNVTDNGMLSFNRRDTKTYGGAISGPGAVTQSGSGTTVLTGSNTYTGGTKIAAGTLQLGNGGSSGSIVGNVTDNGMLSFNRRDTKTYGGAISGPGAVTQSGSGTTVLTGSNTYTGGTKIAVGTLQLGNGGSSGSIVGNVTDNGMLSFNRRDTKTYGGAISGPGAVTQSGSGTTVLTGSNTYTGGTKIAAGTLQLGNGGSSGSIVGNVTDNGMLSFNRRDTKTYGGAISGPGAVTQSGSGTTVLTGSNTYTGGTKIAVGTLQLGNGGSSGSIVGNVTDNGMLSFNRRDTKTYGGAISGPGAVTQSGSGTTVLTGSNTYTGATNVQAGTLQAGVINALSPNSAVTVASSATLALNGLNQTVAGLNNNGTVIMGRGSAPGTTLTVQGNYVGNNATIVLNTLLGDDSSRTDRVVLDGGRALNSTALLVKHVGGNGTRTAQGIDVVQAINGATTDAGAFSLDPQSDGYRQAGAITAGAYDYSLKRGGNGGQANDWYLVSQLRSEVGAYLDNRLAVTEMQIHTLHDRQGLAPGVMGATAGQPADANTWARVEGTVSERDGVSGQRMSDTRYSLHAGSDVARFNDGNVRVGVVAQYGSSSGSTSNGQFSAKQRVEGYSAGVYGTWYGNHDMLSGPYVDTWLMYGAFDNHVSGQGLPTESYHSQNMTASVEGGWSFRIFDTSTVTAYLEPEVQVIYSNYWAKDHAEARGTMVSGLSASGMTTRVGVRLHEVVTDDTGKTQMRPFAELNWWHDPSSQTMQFDQTVVHDNMSANRGEFKVGLQGNVTKNLHIWGALGVDTDMTSCTDGHMQVAMKYAW